MLRTKDILDEKDPRVRAKNTDVDFPLNDEYKDIIPEMLKHLRYSQIEKLSKKYDLRPGMGLAAPQLGMRVKLKDVLVLIERLKVLFQDMQELQLKLMIWMVINVNIVLERI